MTKILLVLLITSTMLSAQTSPVPVPAGTPNVIHESIGGVVTDVLAGRLFVRARNAYSVEALAAQLPMGFTAMEPLRPAPPATEDQRFATSPRPVSLTTDRINRTFVVGFDPSIPPARAMAILTKCAGVEIAEPWCVARLHTVNDPLIGQQQHLDAIRAYEGWDIYGGDASMVIAIIDNGVDQEHEDLKDNIGLNTKEIQNNGIDDDGNGYVDDYAGYNMAWREDGKMPGVTFNGSAGGHGTRVAGLAAATTNNAVGIAGVGNRCRFFPIKTARYDGESIIYGYQALLYAADRGFKVANCSWGSVKRPVAIEQDIVDYCVERNMLVVASAGNHGDQGQGAPWEMSNYPSAYNGVMGVAETYTSRAYTSTSGLGRNADVSAPGFNQLSVLSGGGYGLTGGGTSYAAPMAAGAAALVRSKYRGLTAMQALAYMKSHGRDVVQENPGLPVPCPPGIDIVNYMQGDPLATIGIRCRSIRLYTRRGEELERMPIGDTVELVFELRNELASCNDVSLTVHQSLASSWDLQILNASESLGSFSGGQMKTSGTIRAICHATDGGPCLLNVRIQAAGYDVTELQYIEMPTNVTDFANTELVYSMTDDGRIGYNTSLTPRAGSGFAWKKGYQLMSPSGMIATGNGKAVRGYDNITQTPDFRTVKGFVSPQRNVGVIQDDILTPDMAVGIEVTQRVTFPTETSRTTVLSVAVKNISGADIQDLALGYMLDIDVGASGANNRVVVDPNLVPSGIGGSGGGLVFTRENTPIAVAIAAHTADASAQVQLAGMMLDDIVDDADGLTRPDVLRVLSSGTSIQTSEAGDACGVVGVRFPGTLAPDSTKAFILVIGVGDDAPQAVAAVGNTVVLPLGVRQDMFPALTTAPNPATGMIMVLNTEAEGAMILYDVTGARVLDVRCTSEATTLDVAGLPSGTYSLRYFNQHGGRTIPLVIVR